MRSCSRSSHQNARRNPRRELAQPLARLGGFDAEQAGGFEAGKGGWSMFCVAGRCYEESCSTVALVVEGDPSLMNRLRDAIRLAGVMVTGVLSQRPVRALGDEARRPASAALQNAKRFGLPVDGLAVGPSWASSPARSPQCRPPGGQHPAAR